MSTRNPWGGGVLYGMPPEDRSGISDFLRPGFVPSWSPEPAPSPESTIETTRRQVRARIEWLKAQLGMVPAWTHELETLERVLAAASVKESEDNG